MSKDRDYNYPVGFGKPPQHTRFKKGKSGNPEGRPRGSKDFSTLINNELEERVSAKENGRTKRITKRKVVAKQLVNSGASGHLGATKLLLTYMERPEEPSRQAIAQTQTPRAGLTDDEMLALYVEAYEYLGLGGCKTPPDDDSCPKS
jgi:hypothetical protein